MKHKMLVQCLTLFALVMVFVLGGCARHTRVIVDDDGGVVDVEVDQRNGGYGSGPAGGPARGPARGYYESRLPNIPPGHMPPPGQCRIWYPGKPPGHQPLPGNCHELQRRLPPGAWLIGDHPLR